MLTRTRFVHRVSRRGVHPRHVLSVEANLGWCEEKVERPVNGSDDVSHQHQQQRHDLPRELDLR